MSDKCFKRLVWIVFEMVLFFFMVSFITGSFEWAYTDSDDYRFVRALYCVISFAGSAVVCTEIKD